LTTLRLIINDEIEPTTGPDRKLAYRLTDDGIKDGLEQLQYVSSVYNERAKSMAGCHP
jgi:hypothetical protein